MGHPSVDAVRGGGTDHLQRNGRTRGDTGSRRFLGRGQELQSRQSTGARNSVQNCHFCALSHPTHQCSAYGRLCSAGNKPNHFARSKACKKKSVSELPAEDFLFSVTNTSSEAPWRILRAAHHRLTGSRERLWHFMPPVCDRRRFMFNHWHCCHHHVMVVILVPFSTPSVHGHRIDD